MEAKDLYLCAEQNKRMMKKLFTLLLILTSLPLHAQTEDVKISFDGPTEKDFGGFILDMGSMLGVEPLNSSLNLPSLNSLELWTPQLFSTNINPNAYKFNPNVTYYKGSVTGMSNLYTPLYGFGAGNFNWQGASYKLKNGIRINTYGQYNADGYKVYNPSALPWQRNNFNAAFEVKSANGNFGIKVEVQGGRNNPY